MGARLLESLDFAALQNKCLGLINQALAKKAMIFEDKLIVEYALGLWVGCILHHQDLFEKFTHLDGEVKADQFLLAGLLFCPHESVREEF
jgi:hypothetical protein